MRLLVALLLAVVLMAPAHGQRASCAVVPTAAIPGAAFTVTVSGLTRNLTPYGWFVVFDQGPTTKQAVSSMDYGPVPQGVYGDNGSYMLSWDVGAGVAQFRFYAKLDPGPHVVTASYRKVFASCAYSVV
jgi:hypothetical protein